MKAIVQDTYGGPDVLRLEQVEQPRPGDDEVLVRVRAAGVDRGVWHLMTGLPYLTRLAGYGLRAPKNPVPGVDLAGVVEEVGANVTRFSPGDQVFGIGKGAYAQYAVAPERKLAAKPSRLTFEQAAALAVSGLTALQAVRDQAQVRQGQSVLVLGASGGVGSYAVQIAKALGAQVTGVCSAGKADLVRSLGADTVLDYRTQDFADGQQRWDAILDTGGVAPLSRLRRALTPSGTLVIVGGETSGRLLGGIDRQLRALLLSPLVGQRLRVFVSSENAADLPALAAMVDAGTLTPALDRTFPLAEAPQALDHLTGGQARGKVVITV